MSTTAKRRLSEPTSDGVFGRFDTFEDALGFCVAAG
jgi:hypothetical protein